jgi:hypothetical protein
VYSALLLHTKLSSIKVQSSLHFIRKLYTQKQYLLTGSTACCLKLDRDTHASIHIRFAGTSKLIAPGEIRMSVLKESAA